ncbi:MAG: glycosyltransferase family 4 protein [Clostridiales bacterium]|nr:glycosyltransferase family 4 protein [Clostridiales bacterium]HBM81703.1 glycosyltransferase WbuB [Clostridiaceae bacterium]
MNILFLTQYCPPEVGAPQNRIFEFAKCLKKYGHEVSILTAMPNYPKGEIFEGYKGKKSLLEEIECIKIIRTSIYATKSNKFTKRLRNYLSFSISSVITGRKYVKNVDVIITESPPLFLGYSGYLLSRIKKCKYVFNVSDLWPESAVKLGVLHNKFLINASTWLEEFCYKKADLITGQTRGIVDNIKSRIAQKDKVHLLTNGVDTELFGRENRSEDLRREWGISDKFAACYAGIHGIAQGLEVIINAAKLLRDNENICFVFIGEGPEKQKLISLKEKYKLNNVLFFPMQAKKQMPRIIASMDAAVIPLKKLDLFKGALPSKMFEALASELPIVLSVEGEAEKLIRSADAGICVEPENSEEIAQAVLKLYKDEGLRKHFGENGRQYVMNNYSRQNISKMFEGLLQSLIK